MRRLGIALVGVVLAAMQLVPAASAAVRTGSITLNPNPAAPQFGSPAPKPLIPVTVSYDDQAGSITLSEGGGIVRPYEATEGAQVRVEWEGLGEVELTHCAHTTGVETSTALIGWPGPVAYYNPGGTFSSQVSAPSLTDDKIGGELHGQGTVSADGSTVTVVWSDPAVAGQNFTCFMLLGREVVFAGYEASEPSPAPAPPPQPNVRRAVVAHRAARAQLAALTAVFRQYRRHERKALGGLDRLRDVRVTNNGGASAALAAGHPVRDEQPGNRMFFEETHGHWHVFDWGTAAGRGVPKPVLRALGL
jgi:hypothetical protein